MVINYRQLNKRILTSRAPDRNGKVGKVISNYPIPLLGRLEGCKYFSILDLGRGYHDIGLSERSKLLTTFTNHSGKFQWNIMPFGIGIGVQTFSFVINKAIGQCSDFAANYLGDIIVYSRTVEDHIKHLEQVLLHCRKQILGSRLPNVEFIQGKLNKVADVILRLKNEGLYVEHSDEKPTKSKVSQEDRIEKILDIATNPSNFEKVLNMNKTVSIKELLHSQKRDKFCRRLAKLLNKQSDFRVNHQGLFVKQISIQNICSMTNSSTHDHQYL